MKIHVVQKGETLWNISQKYGVDFDLLVQMNTHLSNPEMIMPGMKIKIPSNTKQVKKEDALAKDKKKQQIKEKKDKKDKKDLDEKKDKKDKKETLETKKKTEKPFKDTSDKAMPVIKEDDSKKPKIEKDDFPMKPIDLPKMPVLEKDYTVDKKMPKLPNFEKTKNDIDVTQTNINVEQQQPIHEQIQPQFPMHQPMQQSMMHQPMQQPTYTAPSQVNVMPMQHYPNMPCCGGSMNVPYSANNVPYALSPHHHQQGAYHDVGEGHPYNQANVAAPYSNLPYNQEDMMESSSSSMGMPEVPYHLAGVQENQIYNPHAQSYQGHYQMPMSVSAGQTNMPQQMMYQGYPNYGYQQPLYPNLQMNAGYGQQQAPMGMSYPQGYMMQQSPLNYQQPTSYNSYPSFTQSQRQEDVEESE